MKAERGSKRISSLSICEIVGTRNARVLAELQFPFKLSAIDNSRIVSLSAKVACFYRIDDWSIASNGQCF